MARFIALYLPQYHPIPENDQWWGKGFTEWVNVAKARPLFKGHVQPHIPADLGFYDLRLPETRIAQAELAKKAGIEGFMYYHYWFGDGKQLLERPFEEVVNSGSPDFPFSLCWANHSWYKKDWGGNGSNKLLIEQQYQGECEYEEHFNHLLPAFRDKRYIRVNGKLLFGIYDVPNFDDIKTFISTWRRLAKENGLNDFFFIAQDSASRNKEHILSKGINAIFNVDIFNCHHNLNIPRKVLLLISRKVLKIPTVFDYKYALDYMIIDDCKNRDVIPCIAPNWDHSPRSGMKGIIIKNPNPGLFKTLCLKAIDTVKDKPEDEQIVIVKSWNEWGEGNYMEPDMEFGDGFITAMREAIDER